MKKITSKQRKKDIRIGYLHRSGLSRKHKKLRNFDKKIRSSFKVNDWIQKNIQYGLNAYVSNHKVSLSLPKTMNFSSHYESTVLHLIAIRKLAAENCRSKLMFKLRAVNFDNLENISTSAALVLTAEISKWDDTVRKALRFNIEKWKPHIIRQLYDLGYFELFKNNPFKNYNIELNKYDDVKLVRYIKGNCGDNEKARILKEEIKTIVGEDINKWTFLHSGLTEAITNVTHHAYPDKISCSTDEKNWYLSGSYQQDTKTLKIVFYDQGIGIPKSLPASKIWEKALVILSKLPIVDRKKDEVLLKAAVEINRTRTGMSDRGKGLQDLLEFIKHRDNGYLSIISLKGLYKYSLTNGSSQIKTEGFDRKLPGTLIIWNVSLDH